MFAAPARFDDRSERAFQSLCCQDMPRTASVRAATHVTALSLTREAWSPSHRDPCYRPYQIVRALTRRTSLASSVRTRSQRCMALCVLLLFRAVMCPAEADSGKGSGVRFVECCFGWVRSQKHFLAQVFGSIPILTGLAASAKNTIARRQLPGRKLLFQRKSLRHWCGQSQCSKPMAYTQHTRWLVMRTSKPQSSKP